MKRWVRSLCRSSDGAVAPTVALSLFGLIAVGGIAFDYARLASLDTELQNAADQAALAAATQLDGQARALERAAAAADALIENGTRFSNDGDGYAVDIDPVLIFFANKPDAEADTNGFTDVTRFADAKFVKVAVIPREAFYALTPIVGAFRSGEINAEATAGLGSAICKVPPLMICNPTPGTPFDAAAARGVGIKAVSRGPRAPWTAGGFGFLGPGDTPSTQEGMAYENPSFTCQQIDTGDVNSGNPVPAVTAVNTRFDIHDYGSGGGGTLSPCRAGACPSALNVTKPLVHEAGLTSTAQCRLHSSNGWRAPAHPFLPRAKDSTDTAATAIDADGVIDAMGLPRDNCHYNGYASPCVGDRFGNGAWARRDYFDKYHNGHFPAGWEGWTRYETYRWEVDNGHIPGTPSHPTAAVGGLQQYGAAICNASVPDPARDRRVFTVAIGENCAALTGSSTPVQIGGWVDMFFVEPATVTSGSNPQGEIYLEVIGASLLGGNNQITRRDAPYLVK